MGLSYFWFIAAAVIGAMDLYFGNAFLLVISAAAFTTALFSFFLSSVYLQVAIFTVISLEEFNALLRPEERIVLEDEKSTFIPKFSAGTLVKP